MIADLTFDEDVEFYDEPEDFDDDESFEVDEAFEEDEDDDEDEAAELLGALLPGPLKFLDPVGAAVGAIAGRGRGRKKKRPSVRPSRATGLYRRPISRGFVTHKQLKASLARVQRSIRKNAGAIRSVSSRASSNRTRLNQQNRINVRQGRQIRSIRKEMDQQAQTQMLLSLLNRTEEVEVLSSEGSVIPDNTTLTIKREIDPITFLLPALSGNGASASGLNNPLLLFALMGRD